MSNDMFEKLRTMSQIEFIKLIKNIDNEKTIEEIVKLRSEGIELSKNILREEDIERKTDSEI